MQIALSLFLFAQEQTPTETDAGNGMLIGLILMPFILLLALIGGTVNFFQARAQKKAAAKKRYLHDY